MELLALCCIIISMGFVIRGGIDNVAREIRKGRNE